MSSRRREGFRRNVAFEDRHRFLIIAIEGVETEPRYFMEFRTSREARIQMKLVPNSNHKSSPEEVLERLIYYFRRNGMRGDEGWIVIDRDAWTETELNNVHREANERGFYVALSNPCFELWLYLHLCDARPFNDRHDCQRGLAGVLVGYSPDTKGAYDAPWLIANVTRAIERAKGLDEEKQNTWQRRQSTRVYKLVERLLDIDAVPRGPSQ